MIEFLVGLAIGFAPFLALMAAVWLCKRLARSSVRSRKREVLDRMDVSIEYWRLMAEGQNEPNVKTQKGDEDA